MLKDLFLEGFRMPGEWEKQKSVWIVWPYNKKDWPGLFDKIPEVVSRIVCNLSINQTVNLIIRTNKDKLRIKLELKKFKNDLSKIKFHQILTNRIWIRDSGPLFLINNKERKKIILNFRFNGWSKYSDYQKDDKINAKIAKLIKIKKIEPKIKVKKNLKKIVLEGGAIDVNGRGSILLTRECLLSKVQERNPGVNKLNLENAFRKYLNLKNFIWLNKGIKGDDTHGHIDDIARFVSPNTIMAAIEKNKKDRNFKNLNENLQILKKSINTNGKKFKIIKIPMPKPIYINNVQVPASYLNFYIANRIVLLPVFNDENDKKVFSIFKKFFKKRKVIPIDCSELIWGFGAIHCMTQQEPFI